MVYVIQVCCVYSAKLLMMDRGAVRNKQVVSKICTTYIYCCVFYVLLTLHLSIISVINQLNAQIPVL